MLITTRGLGAEFPAAGRGLRAPRFLDYTQRAPTFLLFFFQK